MSLQCENCNRFFSNYAGFVLHKKYCTISKNEKLKIRDLYLSGLILIDIMKLGYTRTQINHCIEDVKRSKSEVMKISHAKENRKKIVFKKNITCINCYRTFNYGNFQKHICFTEQKINEVRELYTKGLSLRKIIEKGFNKSLVIVALKNSMRTYSESSKLGHKNPDRYKHTEETKAKIRAKRINYLKKHPFENSWRRTNVSYIEKIFISLIEKNLLANKFEIVHEFSVFPYYLDFAFLNIKLDVEIDGSQHWRIKERIESDKKRDELLISKGWKVYRIPEFKIKQQFCEIEKDLLLYLNNFESQPKILSFGNGIIEYEKIRELKLKKINEKRDINKINRDERVKIRLSQKTEKLNQANIDFSKFGWLRKLSKIWCITHTSARIILKKSFPEIYTNAYHKKTMRYVL